jgi:2-keto-4-pentenoate hydratase/2-oxohepta-3-ene-1,7-dioic acid hydratase in catechol pathway
VRLCRLEVGGTPRWGVIEDELVTPLAAPPWEEVRKVAGAMPLASAKLLPPCEPTKIVAVGLNYRAHATEMGKELPEEPLLFLKAPSSLLPPGGAVVLPRQSSRVEHEGELALVIGRTASKVNASHAL